MSAILGNGSVTFGDNSVQSTSLPYATKLMNTENSSNAYRRGFVIMNDGRVKGWGHNAAYGLGTGSATDHATQPQDVGFPPSFPGAAEVHTGYYRINACLDVNGQLWMWGDNACGGCGVGNTSPVKSPVNVSLITNNSIYGKTVTQVVLPSGVETNSASVDFILVLCSDGTVHACGYNGYGQCGNGNTTNQSYFVRCGTLTNVSHIATGRERYTTSMAVSNGFCYVWGYNGDANLGNGNTSSNVYSPQLRNNGSLSGKTVSKLGSCHLSSLALCTDGTLHGWGNQRDGQFGLGNTSQYTTPVQINTNVASMYTPHYDWSIIAVIKTDNTVYYAGHPAYLVPYDVPQYDSYSNLTGYGQNVTYGWYKLVNYTGTPQKVIHCGTGSYNSLWVMMTDGSVWAWGYNGTGQLGIGSDIGYVTNGVNSSDINYSGPVQVKCDAAADIMCYGNAQYHCLAILTRKGKVKTCGHNGTYGVGFHADYNIHTPTAIPLL